MEKEKEEGGHGNDADPSCSDEEAVKCSACEEPVLAHESSIDRNYHDECWKLPKRSKSHLHMKHHLHYHYFNSRVDALCNLCESGIESDYYFCKKCVFHLHIKCFRPPCLFKGQNHRFISLSIQSLESISYTCNACGTLGDLDSKPRLCTTCHCVFHHRCSNLKRSIFIPQHHHLITLKYNLFQTIHNPEVDYCSCRICQREFKREYGGYVCASCKFVSHVDCGLKYIIRDREATATKDETALAAAIKHSSHAHELILVDEEINDQDDKRCNGCLLPILPPFYTCRECNFCLDKICVNLPQQLKDKSHPNMVLRAEGTDLRIRDIIRCVYCDHYVQIGFVYVNEDRPICDTAGVDARCAKFLMEREGLKHKGHPHQLFHPGKRIEGDVQCSACGMNVDYMTLRCEICDFTLDIRCAGLPHKVINDRYDEHPLFLTYQQEDDGCDKYYCLICAQERDPTHWFYCCVICGFDAHPDCLLGKNPYVRLGRSDKCGSSEIFGNGNRYNDLLHLFGGHPHPLTFVDFSEDYHPPKCHGCSHTCEDLALECSDPQCKYATHISCLWSSISTFKIITRGLGL